MNGELLGYLSRRPALYEKSTAAFWNDPHVSKGMLKAHLDPHFQAATREHAFVDRSVAWIQNTLPPRQYGKLIDFGCGPGLYAERFARCGYAVTGVDISERSLSYARQIAEEKNLFIDYRLQDYTTFEQQQAFDVATLIYCDFGVLKPEDRRRLLQAIFRALKPNGAFVVDMFTQKEYRNKPENTSIQYYEDGFWSDEPHALIQSFFRFDNSGDYCYRYLVLTNEDLRCYHIWNHTFGVDELRMDLLQAGFARVEFFNDVAGAPYAKGGRTLCAVAHKNP